MKNDDSNGDVAFVILMVIVVIVCFMAPMCMDAPPAVHP